jgi:FeS assembly SUF system protein
MIRLAALARRTGVPVHTREGSLEPIREEDVVEVLRTIYDPEIPVNIYDLGLIYGIDRAENGDLHIRMTLTAPACPVAGTMPGMVEKAVRGLDGVGEVSVELVWDPPWSVERMSDEARLALNMYD